MLSEPDRRRSLRHDTSSPQAYNPLAPQFVAKSPAFRRALADLEQRALFREDLRHRFGKLVLRVPPLAERREDVPLLARHFLTTVGVARGSNLSARALVRLQDYHWPGNVRELRAVIESAAILAPNARIDAEDIDPLLRHEGSRQQVQLEFEIRRTIEALREVGGDAAAAAALLGVNKTDHLSASWQSENSDRRTRGRIARPQPGRWQWETAGTAAADRHLGSWCAKRRGAIHVWSPTNVVERDGGCTVVRDSPGGRSWTRSREIVLVWVDRKPSSPPGTGLRARRALPEREGAGRHSRLTPVSGSNPEPSLTNGYASCE